MDMKVSLINDDSARKMGCKRRSSFLGNDCQSKRLRLEDQEMAHHIKEMIIDSSSNNVHGDCLSIADEAPDSNFNAVPNVFHENEKEQVQRLYNGKSTISLHPSTEGFREASRILPEKIFQELTKPCLAVVPYKPPADFILSVVEPIKQAKDRPYNPPNFDDKEMELDEFNDFQDDWSFSDTDNDILVLD